MNDDVEPIKFHAGKAVWVLEDDKRRQPNPAKVMEDIHVPKGFVSVYLFQFENQCYVEEKRLVSFDKISPEGLILIDDDYRKAVNKAKTLNSGLADSESTSSDGDFDRAQLLSNAVKRNLKRKRSVSSSKTSKKGNHLNSFISSNVKCQKMQLYARKEVTVEEHHVVEFSCPRVAKRKNIKQIKNIPASDMKNSCVEITQLPTALLFADTILLGVNEANDNKKISLQYTLGLLASDITKSDIALRLSAKHNVYSFSLSPKVTSQNKNQSSECCDSIEQFLHNCNMVFFCETNSAVIKEVLITKIIPNMKKELSIVIFALLDARDSILFSKIFKGKFLEVPIFYTSNVGTEQLIYAAGNKTLFETVEPFLKKLAARNIWLGVAGNIGKLNLILSGLLGSMIASFSEALMLTEESFNEREEIWDLLFKLLRVRGLLPQIFQVAMMNWLKRASKEKSNGNSILPLTSDKMKVVEEDMHNCSNMARYYEFDFPVLDAARQVLFKEMRNKEI